MKKKVNGKVIDINIDIFELAFEGLAMNKPNACSISDKTSENSNEANKIIEEYENVYKCIPFPLYAIENEIKYVVIANILIKKNKVSSNNIWVDKALNVKLEDNTVIRFVGTTWSMISSDKVDGVRHSLKMKDYADSVGYPEFKWILQRLSSDKDLKDYYNKFMKEFVEACRNEPMILKWELSKMLNFGYVPDKVDMKSNRIIDTDGNEYIVDIFSTGRKKTGESEFVINFCGGDLVSQKPRYKTTYNYEVMEKSNESTSKFKQCNKEGFAGVFETLVGKGAILNNVGNIPYEGIVVGDRIVYKVENQLYICGFNKYIRPIEIGTNVDIFSVENNSVYIVKNSRCESGVSKSVTYALNPADMQIKLCNIQYS